jgi:hypothetical protein
MIDTNKLIKSFIIENELDVLNNKQIRDLSKKVFSFNPFALAKNNLVLRGLIDSNDILFGFHNSASQGIIITPDSFYFCAGNNVYSFNLLELLNFKFEIRNEKNILIIESEKSVYTFEKEQFNTLKLLIALINEEYEKIELVKKIELEKKKLEENNRLKNLNHSISSTIESLDKNNDGEVDLIENEFNKLFSKNQKLVMDIDKNYIHQFVKISNFIKTKRLNTQKIFESIRDTSSQEELDERVNLLKNQIYSYELLVFHSLNMIGALVSEDMITFYEIYESFDKLGIFNSNWENEVSQKLTNIGDKLDDIMYSIYNMEQNIVSELSHLSYITQESFEDLNRSVTSQLKAVESSINFNNLLTGIQTYQLYKINKNTKSLK